MPALLLLLLLLLQILIPFLLLLRFLFLLLFLLLLITGSLPLIMYYSPRVTISHMRIPKPQTSDLGVKTEKYSDSGAIHLDSVV